MNILIVDDIATHRKLLRATLEAEGHTTLEADDGVEVLQILARETVDTVISDILMPNMDGFRLCHALRKSDRLHAIPFAGNLTVGNGAAVTLSGGAQGDGDVQPVTPTPVPQPA